MTAPRSEVRPIPFARSLGAAVRHEARLLFYSPLTYIFQIGFLTALAAATFLIADFYAGDEASIRPMLVFLPWVALILVPALAMRCWPDSGEDRSLELTFTLPLPLSAVVLGKFLAGYGVLLLTLAFTLALPATATYLGEPDGGAVVAGYLGAALLLGAYYAVALFAAALAREQVGAFVIGAAVLFLLLLLGWDVMARLLQTQAPASAIAVLASYSPAQRLTALSRGLVDFGGVAYFLLLTAAALTGAGWLIAARRRGSLGPRDRLRGLGIGAGVIAATVVLIALADRVPAALDLTEEAEFTLHAGTERILARLPEGTEARVFWSAGEPTVPGAIKSHARRVRDLLGEMAGRAGGRLTVESLDPQPDSDAELAAIQAGIRQVPMSSGDRFYLGATLGQGGRLGRIPYFDIRREGLLEYDLAVALNGLSRTRAPKVGLISPLLPNTVAERDRAGLSFLSELRQAYDIAVIPSFRDGLPEGLDVVILIDATILQRKMLYALDQFLMAGGRMIVLLDPYLRANPASNAVTPEPSAEINDVSDLLLAYGLRYLHGEVVGDEAAAAQVADAQGAPMTYPYWLRLREDSLAAEHPATATLNEVFLVEPGAFAIEDRSRVQALVTSGARSGALDRKAVDQGGPRQLALGFEAAGGPRVLAAAVSGPLESAFETPPDGMDPAGQLRRSGAGAQVFAVADVDWIFDPFALQTVDIGGRNIVRPLNDNLTFLLNLVEVASGDDALISIRSRGRLQRPFTRVAALFAAAEARFREEEADLTRRIAELEARAQSLIREAGAESLDDLPPALQDEMRRMQLELLPARQAQRDIRRQIRQEIDRLGRSLTALNLLAGPLLVLLLWAAVVAWRRRP